MPRKISLDRSPNEQPKQNDTYINRQKSSGRLGISAPEMDAKIDEVLFKKPEAEIVQTGLAALRFGKLESEPEHTKVQIVRKGALALLDEAENTIPHRDYEAPDISPQEKTPPQNSKINNFSVQPATEINVADRLKEEIRLLHDTIETTPHHEAKQEIRIARLAELESALKEALQKEPAQPVKQLEITELDPLVSEPRKTSNDPSNKQLVINKAQGDKFAKHFKNFTEQADVYTSSLSKEAHRVVDDPSPILQALAQEFGVDIEHIAENLEDWRKRGLADEDGHAITLQRLQKAQKASLVERIFRTKTYYDSSDYYRKTIRNFITRQLRNE